MATSVTPSGSIDGKTRTLAQVLLERGSGAVGRSYNKGDGLPGAKQETVQTPQDGARSTTSPTETSSSSPIATSISKGFQSLKSLLSVSPQASASPTTPVPPSSLTDNSLSPVATSSSSSHQRQRGLEEDWKMPSANWERTEQGNAYGSERQMEAVQPQIVPLTLPSTMPMGEFLSPPSTPQIAHSTRTPPSQRLIEKSQWIAIRQPPALGEGYISPQSAERYFQDTHNLPHMPLLNQDSGAVIVERLNTDEIDPLTEVEELKSNSVFITPTHSISEAFQNSMATATASPMQAFGEGEASQGDLSGERLLNTSVYSDSSYVGRQGQVVGQSEMDHSFGMAAARTPVSTQSTYADNNTAFHPSYRAQSPVLHTPDNARTPYTSSLHQEAGIRPEHELLFSLFPESREHLLRSPLVSHPASLSFSSFPPRPPIVDPSAGMALQMQALEKERASTMMKHARQVADLKQFYEEQLALVSQRAQQLAAAAGSQRESVEAELQVLRTYNNLKDEQIQRLNQQLEDLTKRVERDNEAHSSEMLKLSQQLDEKQQEIRSLKQRLSQMEAAKAHLDDQLSESASNVDYVQREKERALGELENVRRKMHETDAKASSLKQQMDERETEYQRAIRAREEEYEKRLRQMSLELEEERRLVDSERSEVSRLKHDVEYFRRRADMALSARDEERSMAKAQEEARQSAQLDSRRYETRAMELQSAMERMNDKLERLQTTSEQQHQRFALSSRPRPLAREEEDYGLPPPPPLASSLSTLLGNRSEPVNQRPQTSFTTARRQTDNHSRMAEDEDPANDVSSPPKRRQQQVTFDKGANALEFGTLPTAARTSTTAPPPVNARARTLGDALSSARKTADSIFPPPAPAQTVRAGPATTSLASLLSSSSALSKPSGPSQPSSQPTAEVSTLSLNDLLQNRFKSGKDETGKFDLAISAPYATEKQSVMAEARTMSDLDQKLLQLQLEKNQVDVEREKIMRSGGPRTIRDRKRKDELEAQSDQLLREINAIRLRLRANKF